jgi:hypothetical protein
MKPYAIDLLSLSAAPDAGTLEAMLLHHGLELHFNGRLVWGDIVLAIVAGRRDIAARRNLAEGHIEPWHLDSALYHPEEKALLVAVDYRVPAHGASGDPITERVEWMITCGTEPRTVVLSEVSAGHCAKMLELMDVLDLAEVLWLPLRS